MPRRSLEEADSLAERRKYVRKQNGRAATVWFGRCVVDVNRRPVPVTPGGIFLSGPVPLLALSQFAPEPKRYTTPLQHPVEHIKFP